MPVIPPAAPHESDQRIFLPDITWTDLEVLLAIRGDRAGVRITYLNGVLELMSPSIDHEGVKSVIGRLLEIYALERNIPLNAFGSWTLKNPGQARALEPDECYSIGEGRPLRPDLAIEVLWTSGGLDKLEVYKGLGVPEVWLWRNGAIEVYRLAAGGYEAQPQSVLLPDLDLVVLASHIDAENQTSAVRRYRDALRSTSA